MREKGIKYVEYSRLWLEKHMDNFVHFSSSQFNSAMNTLKLAR